MNRVALARTDVAYLYLTITGLTSTATGQVQIGESAWANVDFTTTPARVLLRGPDAGGGGGLQVPESGPIRVRLSSTPEVRTISAGYLTLVIPSD